MVIYAANSPLLPSNLSFLNVLLVPRLCDSSANPINGYHEAISLKIGQEELIFDNIHPAGIPRKHWLNNFYSPLQDLGQSFKITESIF